MENNLFEEFTNFEGVMRRYLAFKRKNQGPFGDPHRGQGRILALLKIQPEITQKELTYLLGMRPQSLGELLTKLEKSGLITREPAESDRRVMVIHLTEDGRTIAEASKEDDESIFDQLTEEEQGQLSSILGKLTKIMSEELPQEDDSFGEGFDYDMRRKMMKAFKNGEFPRGFGGHPHGGRGSREDFFNRKGHHDFPKNGQWDF